MADRPQLRLVQGENVWRLWRTDRDGVSKAEVLDTVGPAMYQLLRRAGAQFAQTDPWQIVIETGEDNSPIPDEWRIGVARPIQALAATQDQFPEPLPAGVVLGDVREILPDTIPSVRGQKAWSVDVRFWWRAPDATIDWPALQVNWAGQRVWTLDQPDWLLARAIVPATPDEDPGDATFGEVVAPKVASALKLGGAWIVGSVLVIGAGLLVWKLAGTRR